MRAIAVGCYSLTNAFESKIARLFKERGYYTIVSSGSRGAADVIAISKNEILFIQCKRNRGPSSTEKQRLIEVAHQVSATPLVATCRKRRLSITEIR